MGLIKEDSAKPVGVDYRIIGITQKGINEIYNKEFRQKQFLINQNKFIDITSGEIYF